MSYFVKEHSIVKKIWGKSDTILFIFAGAAAEFALNKAVDWLYFTGKLPADPLGRLFSTVTYAKKIVFATEDEANKAIGMLKQIHSGLEKSRGYAIPDWAYRDVLFMLIYYSIAAYELLEHALSDAEKEEVYHVFYRVGTGMGLKALPFTYKEWLPVRKTHLMEDLQKSTYTVDLFKQYRLHLGKVRFKVLIEAQKLVVPKKVKTLMQFSGLSWLAPVIPMYKLSRILRVDWFFKNLLLPNEYKAEINALDMYIG